MKYKELLDLYKSGRLSEEESKKLEAEIEKQEAISEYLYPDEEDEEYDKEISETEDRGFTREGGKTSAKEDEFVKLVRKSIRKAFIKMGAVVTAAVLVIILLMITILPKAVDLLYIRNLQLRLTISTQQRLFRKVMETIALALIKVQ